MKIISSASRPKVQHCSVKVQPGVSEPAGGIRDSRLKCNRESDLYQFCVQVFLLLCFPSSSSQALTTPAVRPCSLLLISPAPRTPTWPSTPACSPHPAPSPTTLPRLPLRAQRVISRRPSSTAARWDPRGRRRATRSRRRVREEPCLTPQWGTSIRATRSSCSPARRTCPSTRWRR